MWVAAVAGWLVVACLVAVAAGRAARLGGVEVDDLAEHEAAEEWAILRARVVLAGAGERP